MPEEILVESASQPHRLSAVWFADIVGYTRLSSENQVTALWLVRLLQSTAETVAKADGGRVVKRIGDAVLAEFSSTHGAVLAAATLQQIFQQQTRHSGAAAALRIGVHAGDVVVDADGDIYGDGVNLAARLQAAAEPGATVSSEDVWRQLRGRPEFTFQPMGDRQLDADGLRMAIYGVVLTPAGAGAISHGAGRGAGDIKVPVGFRVSKGATCPYMGLQAFSEGDAPLYFGREAFSRHLFEKIHQHRLVSLVSASGSGKSSLLQAGLLPLLRSEITGEGRWDAVVFTPGPRPFHSLAAGLVERWARGGTSADLLREAEQLGSDCSIGNVSLVGAVRLALDRLRDRGVERLLLVVDQFEELFTQTRDDGVRLSFVEQLIEAAELVPVRLVLTLRADFYGQAIGLSRNLSDRMQNGLLNVGPMSRDELTRAVVEPAAVAGLQFERGLVERILDDVKQQAGALPLLQFALTELWYRRQGRLLTHAAYEEIGRVEGAIGRRADQVIAQWRPDEQERLIRELTRLVRVTAAHEEGSDTRVRARVSDLPTEVQAMVRSFVDARLLVADRDMATGDDTVEVAHEALIRSWPRLRKALDGDRSFLLWRQRLRQRIEEWEELGASTDLLLVGSLLAEARRWARARADDLNDREREFIRRSGLAAKGRRKLALTLAGIGVFAVAAGASAWAYSYTDQYQVSRALADGREIVVAAQDSTATEWYRALIDAGRVEMAVEGARTIEALDRRSLALAGIANILEEDGDPEQGRRVRLEAAQLAIAELAKARSTKDPELRARSLARMLPVLTESGRGEDAAAVAREALASAQEVTPAPQRDELIVNLAPLIAEAGDLPLAMAAVHKGAEGEEAFFALTSIAGILLRKGRVSEALEIVTSVDSARQNEALDNATIGLYRANIASLDETDAQNLLAAMLTIGAPATDLDLFVIGRPLIEAGAASQVLRAAEALEDSASRRDALRALVPDLAAAGHLREAQAILDAIPPRERATGQARVALESARYGAPENARRLIPAVIDAAESQENPSSSAFLFAHLIETFELLGEKDDAVAIALRADSAALLIQDEDSRSNTTREIAKRYATLGLLRKARQVADRRYLSDNDRLEVYTTIIAKYTQRQALDEKGAPTPPDRVRADHSEGDRRTRAEADRSREQGPRASADATDDPGVE